MQDLDFQRQSEALRPSEPIETPHKPASSRPQSAARCTSGPKGAPEGEAAASAETTPRPPALSQSLQSRARHRSARAIAPWAARAATPAAPTETRSAQP